MLKKFVLQGLGCENRHIFILFLCQVVSSMVGTTKIRNFDRRITGSSVIDENLQEVRKFFLHPHSLTRAYTAGTYWQDNYGVKIGIKHFFPYINVCQARV